MCPKSVNVLLSRIMSSEYHRKAGNICNSEIIRVQVYMVALVYTTVVYRVPPRLLL